MTDEEAGLTNKFNAEFLAEYLIMHGVDANHLSSLIQSQILSSLNAGSPDRIVEEIAHLEGHGTTRTKPATQFSRGTIKGYWHKHYESIRFTPQNLINHWKLNDAESVKFNQQALELARPYEGQNTPETLWKFCGELASKFVEGSTERWRLGKLTGEWIVYQKHAGKNFYLTVASHLEEDPDILRRIQACQKDFPILGKR